MKAPFANQLQILLPAVFDALRVMAIWDENGRKTAPPTAESLKAQLLPAINAISPNHSGLDTHISSGAYTEAAKREKRSPDFRLGQLVFQGYFSAVDGEEAGGRGAHLPSPLRIVFEALRVPDMPQSKAYAQTTCVAFLCSQFKLVPARKFPLAPLPSDFTTFSPEEIEEAYTRLETEVGHRDNRGGKKFRPIELLLLHYLAMRGVLVLRFGTARRGEKPVLGTDASKSAGKSARVAYCVGKSLHELGDQNGVTPEFRLYSNRRSLPNIQMILNELFGIQVPIQGFDTIFAGGLRVASTGGTVINVEGPPGSGKTSFALSVAASLAAYGTTCIYCTVEEREDDLGNRIASLTPKRLRRLAVYREISQRKWFFPLSLEGLGGIEGFRSQVMPFLEDIAGQVRKTESKAGHIPSSCPLLIVIDSLTPLLSNPEGEGQQSRAAQSEESWRAIFFDVLKRCSDLGAITIVLSEKNDGVAGRISYLVDTVIALDYKETDQLDRKPIRVFELRKTRHQISRPGSHLFHLSGPSGFRLCPQVPSQIDARKEIALTVPKAEFIMDTLQTWEGERGKEQNELRFGSQLLLLGVGSSGKAGLAMRILMTPVARKQAVGSLSVPSLADFHEVFASEAPRILAISFLYPEAYYEKLELKLRANLAKTYDLPELKTGQVGLRIDYLSFYPGYLAPEDFLNKIERTLDAAALEGRPYSGVLIDGLHNVFLQFPSLQSHDMIWPALYSSLRRLGVTTVTTFTKFSVPFGGSGADVEEMRLKGNAPVLHAIIQASDYCLTISGERRAQGQKDHVHAVSMHSGLGRVNRGHLYWDSDKLIFLGGVPEQLPLILPTHVNLWKNDGETTSY